MSLQLVKLETHLLHHRKSWVIGLSIVFICVLTALYIWGSVKAWDNFEEGNLTWYGQMKDRSKKVFVINVQNGADKVKKQQEFDALSATIQGESSRCNFIPLFSWQQSIQLNQERMQKCQQLVGKVRTFGKALDAALGHLHGEAKVALIISEAAKTTEEVTDTEWLAVAKQWANAETKLQKLSSVASFNTTKDLAVGKAKSIQAAWSALITANGAKDRAKYEEADAMLTQAYGTLDEITQSSETKLLPLIAELERSYNEAYKNP
jgi:hypothetical protein